MNDRLFEKLAKRFGYRVFTPSAYHQRDNMPSLDLSECDKCGTWYVNIYTHQCTGKEESQRWGS